MRRALLLAATLAALAIAAPGSVYAAPPGAPADDGKAEAVAHFERGLTLFDTGAWDAALAEFLEAQRRYPLRNAGYQAALCLEKLGRDDEALDQIEGTLRTFGDAMPPDAREKVQRKLIALRARVGTIEIDGAEPGAALTIDGRSRGTFPPLAPLRVPAGSHVVRVSRSGYAPFEGRIEVAGGGTARLEVHLSPLARAGRLTVNEQAGAALDVVIDGSVAGKTPWEGLLAPGEHVLALRGEGGMGTPPIPVTVEADRAAALTLTAEALTAALRVEPAPVHAAVAIDGVAVGSGVWDGRLRAGAHVLEIAAPGFVPVQRPLTLGLGERRVVRLALVRDPTSPFWPKPPRRPRFVVELDTSLALGATLGGDVAGGCSEHCALGPAVGGVARAHGGYELGSGLGFGLTAGFLTLQQATTGRSTAVQVFGLKDDPARADDVVTRRGALAGAWAAFRIDMRFPLHVRLGAGALLGRVSDARRGAFTARSGTSIPFGSLVETQGSRALYLAPEFRIGLPLGPRVELSLGLTALVLVDPSRPRWDPKFDFDARPDGDGTFAADVIAGPVVVILAPGIGARYDL